MFAYTTGQNIHERPEGIKIASFFILSIVIASLISRVLRTTELRVDKLELDDVARDFISEAGRGTIRIIANRKDQGDLVEYQTKEREKRADNHIPQGERILFFEVTPGDASEFSDVLRVQGVNVGGFKVLRTSSPAIPNAIAGLLLDLRNRTYSIPHAYFGWTEGNPLVYLLKFLAFGEGDTAPVCREVLRKAEPDPDRRPRIHLG